MSGLVLILQLIHFGILAGVGVGVYRAAKALEEIAGIYRDQIYGDETEIKDDAASSDLAD